jgi:hypothetical protein
MTDLSTRPPAVDYFLAQGQHSIRINDQFRPCLVVFSHQVIQ